MEKSVNKVELKGNVGADPRIVTLENGNTVVRFSLATHENYKDKSGEWREETTWHNVVAWAARGMPDLSAIRKGMFLELIGKIRYARFRSTSGEEKNMTEIQALKIIIPRPEENTGQVLPGE